MFSEIEEMHAPGWFPHAIQAPVGGDVRCPDPDHPAGDARRTKAR